MTLIRTIDPRFALLEARTAPRRSDPDEPAPAPASADEIAALAEELGSACPASAEAFDQVCPEVLPRLNPREMAAWTHLGLRFILAGNGMAQLGPAFFRASPAVLDAGAFHYLHDWTEHGLKVAALSPRTAARFLSLTPAFLDHVEIYQVGKWARTALDILNAGPGREPTAGAYLSSAVALLDFMDFRELKDWSTLGLTLTRRSTDLGFNFFDRAPARLEDLYRYERRGLFELCLLPARLHPEEAVDLYDRCPAMLMALSPSVRGRVLDAVRRMASNRPEIAAEVFGDLAGTLSRLSFPSQKEVMDQEPRIGEVSSSAARVYCQSVLRILERVPETFLPLFVSAGLAVLQEDEAAGLDYFALASDAAGVEVQRWQEAALLEDHRRVLGDLARALTGRALTIQSTEELELSVARASRAYPTTDGETIFLPPFVDQGGNRRENFRWYKVAAAHQAGYVELGSFAAGLKEARARLETLPASTLALDLFAILEDGRIDHWLGREYRGLGRDLAQVMASAVAKRTKPCELMLWEALVETVLRLTVGLLDSQDLAPNQAEHLPFLEKALMGFFEQEGGPWTSLAKAVELYDYIRRLPNVRPGPRRPGSGRDEPDPRSVSYQSVLPLEYRGRIEPELLPEAVTLDVAAQDRIDGEGGFPMPLEELKKMLENLKDLSLVQVAEGRDPATQGLFFRDPHGLLAKNRAAEPNREDHEGRSRPFAMIPERQTGSAGPFYYDEWDYMQKAYRRRWCRLKEQWVEAADTARVEEIYARCGKLIQSVRRQFQRIRPDVMETIRRVEWGDEIDLTALIQSVIDRKLGADPSDRIFSRKEKRLRRVTTVLLMDLSASTDERVPCRVGEGEEDAPAEKKIIDTLRESLVVMMEALEALDDEYAMFGFSGYGRGQVDFYTIKDFGDRYSETLKGRISGLEPKQSTRMGPAIRHAVSKLRKCGSDQRLLILLSDGFPQDHDYGEDRASNDYGLNDTMMALLEARREGIEPFCITVDQAGHDYLRRMFDPRSYLVIQDIHSLPEVMPRVVEALIR